MRHSLALCAAGLLLAAPALGETPKALIKGPVRVAPEGTIVLDARGSAADRPLRWKLDGPDVPFLTLDQDGRTGVVALVPSAPPGIYRFTLIARGIPAGENELDADAAIHVVTVEEPAPPAPPDPAPPDPKPPTPGPSPSPVAGKLHVSLVLDLDAITPEVAVVREGVTIRQAFQAMDAVYRTYAATSPEAARLNLVAIAQREGFPCLIVQDAAGKVLAAEKATADESGIVARVRTLRGGQ